jgi:hypothetical protein
MHVSLAAGEIICLDGGQHGVTVRCTNGLLWLTIGNGADYFVEADRPFYLEAGVTAVAEAFKAAELNLSKAEKIRLSCSLRPAMTAPIPLLR